jgi:hypothetical protein
VTDEPKEPYDPYLDGIMMRQAERLAAKPDTERRGVIMTALDMANAERARVKAEEPAEPIEGIITAWIPESDPFIRITVGKLAEECNELAKVCARIEIQGINGIDPDTGRTNLEELWREVADVMAATDVADMVIPIPATVDVRDRRERKRNGFLRWHGMLRDEIAKSLRAMGGRP